MRPNQLGWQPFESCRPGPRHPGGEYDYVPEGKTNGEDCNKPMITSNGEYESHISDFS